MQANAAKAQDRQMMQMQQAAAAIQQGGETASAVGKGMPAATGRLAIARSKKRSVGDQSPSEVRSSMPAASSRSSTFLMPDLEANPRSDIRRVYEGNTRCWA